jgi:hypothetical protein
LIDPIGIAVLREELVHLHARRSGHANQGRQDIDLVEAISLFDFTICLRLC